MYQSEERSDQWALLYCLALVDIDDEPEKATTSALSDSIVKVLHSPDPTQ